MGHAIATQEGLSIEYDEDVCCDICQSVSSVLKAIYVKWRNVWLFEVFIKYSSRMAKNLKCHLVKVTHN